MSILFKTISNGNKKTLVTSVCKDGVGKIILYSKNNICPPCLIVENFLKRHKFNYEVNHLSLTLKELRKIRSPKTGKEIMLNKKKKKDELKRLSGKDIAVIPSIYDTNTKKVIERSSNIISYLTRYLKEVRKPIKK